MERGEVPNMTRDTTYPSPTAAQMGEGAHPFYTNHHQMPLAEEMQMSGQLPHNIQTGRISNSEDASEVVPPAHEFQDMPQAPQELAHGGLASTEPMSKKSRTKVSRACDECRRKKIRCDADSETPEKPCANCTRSNIGCEFTRPAGKRGPSKGYIKTLEKRVDVLEEERLDALGDRKTLARPLRLQSLTMNDQPIPPQGYTWSLSQPEKVAYGSRKRTHSMSEVLPDPPYVRSFFDESNSLFQANQSVNSTNQVTARHTSVPQALAGSRTQDFQPPGTHVDANHINHVLHVSPNGALSTTRNSGGMGSDSVNTRALEQVRLMAEWNEQAVDEYYYSVHPVFPILPHNKVQLSMNLVKAPAIVRSALLYTLNAGANLSEAHVGSSLKKAAEQLMALQLEDFRARSTSDNLIHLQALLLMSLATDSSGPVHMHQSPWIGLALNVAVFLKFHSNRPVDHVAGSDGDTIEKLGRRAWLILFILDRWHASGMGDPFVLSEKITELHPEDGALLGNIGYCLARLSTTLEHLMDGSVHLRSRAMVGQWVESTIANAVHKDLELFGESAEPLFALSPFLHLAYLHVKIMFEKYLDPAGPNADEMVDLSLKVATILLSTTQPINPLAHHFVTLTVVVLLDGIAANNPNKDVKRALEDISAGIGNGRIFPRSFHAQDKPGWDVAIQNRIAKALQQHQQQAPATTGTATAIDRGGLQHLADAAVGESENVGGMDGAADTPMAEVVESTHEGSMAVGWFR